MTANPPAATTPVRSGQQSAAVRVSPYPQRALLLVRGVEQVTTPSVSEEEDDIEGEELVVPPSSPTPTQGPGAVHREARAAAPPPVQPASPQAPPAGQRIVPAAQPLFQLLVRPIVKRTVGQRDTSGDLLRDDVFTGRSFQEILTALWTAFAPRIRGRAVRTDGNWSVEEPAIADWTRLMQFKTSRHLVESTKTDAAWAQWLQRVRGETVKLLIYEYGLAITRAQDYEEFNEAVIRPEQVDRAGAIAEIPLQDVVARLQRQWGATFQAEAVVWRMWANHITRNLNRATWETLVTEDPPEYVASLLRASESRLEHQFSNMRRSAHLALDAVHSAMADYQQFRRDWDALGRRWESHERNLQSRQTILEAFLRDALPPALADVPDPIQGMANVADTEHDD